MIRLDFNIIWTIINLLILYYLMKRFLFDKVHEVLEKRHTVVEKDMADAAASKSDAMDLKKKYEEILNHADENAQLIINHANEEAQLAYDKKIEEAEKEIQRMKKELKTSINLETKKAKEEVQKEVASLAMAAATKAVSTTDSELRNLALYDSFLEEMGE